MSGLFSQVGLAKETATQFSVTAGAGVAGIPNTAVLTKAAHGLRVGDVVTITGSTVAGYNGTWAITAADTNTFTIQTGSTLLGAATATFPVVNATAWGVPKAPSKFFEFNNESVKSDFQTVESKSLSIGNRVDSSARFARYEKGVAGDLELEVLSVGFAWWLELLLGGTTTTTGPADSTAYTHTITNLGSTRGDGITYQKLVPLSSSAGVVDSTNKWPGQVITFKGLKVSKWSLSSAVDGILTLKLSFIGQGIDTTLTLATASYASNAELLTFIGGTLTVDAVAVGVCKSFEIDCDMGLDERHFIANGGAASEPLEAKQRAIKWKAEVEFADATFYTKYVSATAAGSLAAIVAKWTGQTKINGAATTFPSLQVTLPKAAVDGETPVISGSGLVSVSVGGRALNTSTASTQQDAVQIVIVSGDTTAL